MNVNGKCSMYLPTRIKRKKLKEKPERTHFQFIRIENE